MTRPTQILGVEHANALPHPQPWTQPQSHQNGTKSTEAKADAQEDAKAKVGGAVRKGSKHSKRRGQKKARSTKANAEKDNPNENEVVLAELQSWENKQVTGELLVGLNGGYFTACIAAYLTYYDKYRVLQFTQLKEIAQEFHANFVAGLLVINGTETAKTAAWEVLQPAIGKVCKGKALCTTPPFF